MKQLVLIILLLWGNFQLILSQGSSARPLMLYGDTSRVGVPYSKDPHVVNFKGRYLMYHSIPPMKGEPDSGWNIGIAESKDLMNWTKVGEITPAPEADYEKKGLCAPGALVKDGKVHLFYQFHPYSEVWEPMHWGHYETEDFIKWTELPVALAPDKAYDEAGCFSGSGIETEKGHHLVYTPFWVRWCCRPLTAQ